MAAIDEKEESSDEEGDYQQLYVKSPEKIASFASAEQIQSEVSHIISSTKSAKQAAEIDRDDHLVIFVHGFNNNDDQVEQRAVKIDKIYGTKNVITRTFNWKSECKTLRYGSDQFTALLVAQTFARYIELIRMHNKFKRIDIICHSMGNFILCQTILHYCVFHNKLDIFKGFNIICLAPDVETEQYNQSIQTVRNIISSWCHYWCAGDYALSASKWYNDTKKRAGLSKCEMRHLSVVHDIEWKQWSRLLFSGKLNHAYIDQVFSDQALANDILDRLRAIQPMVGNYGGGHPQLEQAQIVQDLPEMKVGLNIEKNQPFRLQIVGGYVGCDESGWLTSTKVISDAILFEFELSSAKYKYTHYKVKKCANGQYNGYYVSYTGSSWCAGLYRRKGDALCIEYCLAENKVIARGTENRIKNNRMEARELRCHLKSDNHYLYFRNDFKVCQVMYDFSQN